MNLISALAWKKDGELTPGDMAMIVSRLTLAATPKEKEILAIFAKKEIVIHMPSRQTA